jgi:post-segregation antitoxin (ccd killing protein)
MTDRPTSDDTADQRPRRPWSDENAEAIRERRLWLDQHGAPLEDVAVLFEWFRP